MFDLSQLSELEQKFIEDFHILKSKEGFPFRGKIVVRTDRFRELYPSYDYYNIISGLALKKIIYADNMIENSQNIRVLYLMS